MISASFAGSRVFLEWEQGPILRTNVPDNNTTYPPDCSGLKVTEHGKEKRGKKEGREKKKRVNIATDYKELRSQNLSEILLSTVLNYRE